MFVDYSFEPIFWEDGIFLSKSLDKLIVIDYNDYIKIVLRVRAILSAEYLKWEDELKIFIDGFSWLLQGQAGGHDHEYALIKHWNECSICHGGKRSSSSERFQAG